MPIHLEFTVTFEDYLSAARLHARRNWWSWFNLTFQEYLAPILGVLIGIYAVLQAVHGVIGVPFIVMAGASLYLVAGLNPRSRLKASYKQTGGGSAVYVEVNETQIRLQGADWKSEFKWAASYSFSEDDRVFLLDVTQWRSIVIPKRACTDSQAAALREMFSERDRSKTPAAVD